VSYSFLVVNVTQKSYITCTTNS